MRKPSICISFDFPRILESREKIPICLGRNFRSLCVFSTLSLKLRLLTLCLISKAFSLGTYICENRGVNNIFPLTWSTSLVSVASSGHRIAPAAVAVALLQTIRSEESSWAAKRTIQTAIARAT